MSKIFQTSRILAEFGKLSALHRHVDSLSHRVGACGLAQFEMRPAPRIELRREVYISSRR